MVDYLLCSGLELRVFGDLFLKYAVSNGQLDLCKYLMLKGVNPKLLENANFQLLHSYCRDLDYPGIKQSQTYQHDF
jgi:hypothetical protein